MIFLQLHKHKSKALSARLQRDEGARPVARPVARPIARPRVGASKRRILLPALLVLGASFSLSGPAFAAVGFSSSAFSHDTVKSLAENLAKKPFEERSLKIERSGAPLTYDEYRDIRFKQDNAIWRGKSSAFQLQLFAPGGLYNRPVDIHLVENGKVRTLPFRGENFEFGRFISKSRPGIVKQLKSTNLQLSDDDEHPRRRNGAPVGGSALTYSGFRVHGFINNRTYREEFAVFQGASYFRALGYLQNYGLSARGLAINTAQPTGEEFPYFRSFWIEKSSRRAKSIVVHALLDSPSLAAAYKFRIRPGRSTIIDVEMTVYPRKKTEHVGLAPLTSMFQFGRANSRGFDDFRPAVHDSEGLLILNGRGEWIWRSLRNPLHLQVSSFLDENPKGFGLMQRNRSFSNYQDLEARYDKRPSLWIEPKGKWGKGAVTLYEIPTNAEINDNIVALWKPDAPLEKGEARSFAYRMYWGAGARGKKPEAVFSSLMTSKAHNGRRLFVIEFKGKAFAKGRRLREADLPKVKASAEGGKITNIVVVPNPVTGRLRTTFLLDPGDQASVDIRLTLTRDDEPISEVFTYRWTKDT